MKVFLMFLVTLSIHVTAHANVSDSWAFDVYLDDKKIGFHQFQVKRSGDSLEVNTKAEFDVKLLFVNLYRYRHENTEVWDAGCLQDIEARTDANGNDFTVAGRAAATGFIVNNGSDVTPLPNCVKTFAYWDPSFLNESRLLNSQTGAYEAVTVENLGEETIRVKDQLVPAVRYRLEAETGPVSLWYSVIDDRWLALESTVEGGRVIRYEPQQLPDDPRDLTNAD